VPNWSTIAARRSVDSLRRHLHSVGTHIGNETDGFAADVEAFVKPLCHLHGARSGKAEL